MNTPSGLPSGQELAQNVIAALTVSFAALSLGASFGILSERGVFAGMLSAALIALVTALFGGTRIQCSGPTAPMTTVTAVIVAFATTELKTQVPGINPDHFINIVILLTAVLMGLMAVFRLGKFISLIPKVVVSGFMNGIAILIWLDQIKQLFGLGGKTAIGGPLVSNLLVTIASVLLIFMLPGFLKQVMPKFASLLSATLLTILIMTAVSTILALTIEPVQLEGSLRSWGDLTALVAAQWPSDWSATLIWLALPFAAQLAMLAYLDTLLTSIVVDKMTKTETKRNQELAAQGIGMSVVALIGGLPGAQATIRSVLLVKEKATMRLAGVLVGIFALIEILIFQDAINLIPKAVFAGVLIKVGWDVFDWKPVRLYLKSLLHKPPQWLLSILTQEGDASLNVSIREMMLIAGTTLVTILWDLNVAVISFTSFFYLYNKFAPNPIPDLEEDETEGFSDED